MGRRVEARYPELRNRAGSAPRPRLFRRPSGLFRLALLHGHLRGSGIGGWSAAPRLATWVNVRSVRGTRGRGKRLGRRVDGAARCAPSLNHPRKTSVERLLEPGLAASIAVCGNSRGRPLSRTFASRTSNGLGASDPSSLFVAATVRLLLPPVTDAKSLRWPRHIRIAAVPFSKTKIRGGGWQSGGRSAGSGLDESGFYSSVAIRDGWETGTACASPSPLAGRFL